MFAIALSDLPQGFLLTLNETEVTLQLIWRIMDELYNIPMTPNFE